MVCLTVVLASCTGGQVPEAAGPSMPPDARRVEWRLDEPASPDDTRLRVAISLGCPAFAFSYVEASESADSVAIYAFRGDKQLRPSGCMVAHEAVHFVPLQEPVGQRDLVNGPSEFPPSP